MVYAQSDILRTEKQPRINGGPRIVYILQCKDCNNNEVKLRKSEFDHGIIRKCKFCANKKRPHESIYNQLKKNERNIDVLLTYDEYLEFTKETNCYYCNALISWYPYGMEKGEYHTRAYFLDRKDHNGPYSKENCVVCCTRCNRFKSNFFSFEEFSKFIPTLKEIETNRLLQKVKTGNLDEISDFFFTNHKR